MLAELSKFGENAALIANSGVQFMDFGLNLAHANRLPASGFAKDSNGTVFRLDYDERDGVYCAPRAGAGPEVSRASIRPTLEIPIADTLSLFDRRWMPIPVLRVRPGRSFDLGPTNWVRARVTALAQPDEDGHSHRVTIAFDTTILPPLRDSAIEYLAPEQKDVGAGHTFMLAWIGAEPIPFVQQRWVSEWVSETFRLSASKQLRIDEDEVELEIRRQVDVAHYLAYLGILGQFSGLPRLTLRSNGDDTVHAPINVDFVLDVGNSRTCGILIEEHSQDTNWTSNRYELTLRDLSEPHLTYSEPFESRMEFNHASFGLDNISSLSGRASAFNWPTIARVGPEALRLASSRRGMEGATGLSSPKRYLWDEEPYAPGWRFNHTYGLEAHEPLATAQPFCKFIDEAGRSLFRAENADAMPVFIPHYSRSSLMTMMLAEVLMQALSQINSPMQRMRQQHAGLPRQLRRVVLTVPPSMPLPEQRNFKNRMDDAVVLLWKSMGWHAEDAAPDDEAQRPFPAFPTVIMKWDEVTCGQVVYLLSECVNHFGGDTKRFFSVMRRRDVWQDDGRLRIASIDIGGGTTDLVVTDFELKQADANALMIEPKQLFRDGFKLAGDDILLHIIQTQILPAISAAVSALGVAEVPSVMSELIGGENLDVQRQMLRHQFTLQILMPAGLSLLHRYETYDPVVGADVVTLPLRQLLPLDAQPHRRAIEYFDAGIRKASGGLQNFDVMNVPVPIDLERIHEQVVSPDFDLHGALSSLSDIVAQYNCDVLLLTGRPSRLPAIPELLRSLMPLTPDRIIPLHNYRAGSWYPFHKHGRIHDPKTTAAVGAMICVLAAGRLPNFNLLASRFDLKSTMRYFGRLDERNVIGADDVYFTDLDLDDPDFQLPAKPFPMAGPARLGFRQLASPHWLGTPLYFLTYREDVRQELHEHVLLVTLEKDRAGGDRRAKAARDIGNDRFRIARVAIREPDGKEGRNISRDMLQLRLNTLNDPRDGTAGYWLDTGTVFE
ncbi:virulence factor [Hypericibacter terrae]|uniref:Virulence factor n=1 Tax=Hypericibacter terrae TaxID=2602015 RepID=A0A5J6MC07_9PROT|nr:virulence factor SrfB [Hypericibacter terrae]QEX14839.1 virulence factor [Hypericibacter terrae]